MFLYVIIVIFFYVSIGELVDGTNGAPDAPDLEV